MVGLRGEFLGIVDPCHAAGRGVEQAYLGTELAADDVALKHGGHLRHDDDALVPLGRAHHRLADAGVAWSG